MLGANGFVGSSLSMAILNRTDWQIFAIDIFNNRLDDCLNHKNFNFFEGDITIEKDWIDEQIKNCDIVLPLAAIATPSLYVKNPLRVYELNFEANMEIIKKCVKHKKRLIFPSTSEIYGMCEDEVFDEYNSNLVLGPIHKERWIYSSIKQLLDRVIWAYGNHENLDFTLFRPFNFIGPKQDDINDIKESTSRVVTQFIHNIICKEPIKLVDGGVQRRSFTFIDDGIDCLLKIIENKNNCASGKIFNIGNPYMDFSIRELAEILLELAKDYSEFDTKNAKIENVSSQEYYGKSYQDILRRVPSIKYAETILGWKPTTDLHTALRIILDYHLQNKK